MMSETIIEKVKDNAYFVSQINRILKNDQQCAKYLPLNADDNSLFTAFSEGILVSRLLLAIDSNCLKFKLI